MFHHLFWAWVWDVQRGERPQPLVNCWFRGSSKSTNAEIIPCVFGAYDKRSYGIYVCNTQAQADDHVQNIADKLSSRPFADDYPALADRAVGAFGHSKGWRRNRLRTRSGMTIDALGLDTGRIRGLKIEDQRPDFLVLDDIDDITDSTGTIEKNTAVLTKSILPAGADDLAVCVIQNKVRDDGIMGSLVNGNADYLRDRFLNGPIPAIQNFEFEHRANRNVIVAGISTWSGKSLARCQKEIDDEGISAFLEENQHATATIKGGIFDLVHYRHCNPGDVPTPEFTSVWVDPAVSDTDNSDAHGVQASSMDANGLVYKRRSWEQRATPEQALMRAIMWADELNADCVGVETDQGGDLWKGTYRRMCAELGKPRRPFRSAKAGSSRQSKTGRVGQQVTDYETGLVVHVLGTHHVLENALDRFPKQKPFDLADADYWCWKDLTQFRESESSSYYEETTLEDELDEIERLEAEGTL